jgi:multidrug efflux pump subunit AcrA (membrane-fusion protein)
MGARLTVVGEESAPVLAVPVAAIARAESRSSVFIRKADGSFERRPVETGRHDDRMIEIVSGLREGESIVVAGVAALETTLASIR